jgi:HK97 family phage major capsid protein/HK97 family phage prohead protease
MRKVKSAPPPGGDRREFVLSDGSIDRMGDMIEPDGWDLSSFKPGGKFNPIALFNHKADQVVGSWANVKVSDGKLVGKFVPAEPGTSELADSVRKLIDQDILRATSVGFEPIESEPLDKDKPYAGQRFIKQALLECSIVSVPANPNAVAIARSLNLSSDILSLAFGEHAEARPWKTTAIGKHAVTTPIERPKVMTTLSQRIEHTQTKLNELRDRLAEGGPELSIDALAELNGQIDQHTRDLSVLKDAEARNGAATITGTVVAEYVAPVRNATPFVPSAPAIIRQPLGDKEVSRNELMSRAAAMALLAHAQRIPIEAACQRAGGVYDHDLTRAACNIYCKAASAPALTTATGWAAELAASRLIAPLITQLAPASVYNPLSSIGLRLAFGRNGSISIPTMDATPTIAGSFVGEGAPIPVRQGHFSSVSLVPKKMAVISVWSREMDEHSTPAIQPLIERKIGIDTSISIDSVLLDTNAATAIRPAGLRNGVSGLTPTAGGGFNALVGDLGKLVGAIVTATNGNVRNLVFLMNPKEGLAISLIQPSGTVGLLPFREEIANNRLIGYQVIQSGTVPAGTIIALDAADYVSVEGDNPRFEVSDQATLHMEDTNPVQIGTVGTPAVVAAPAQSMFQTDSMALRMILPMNWTLSRTGTLAWMAAVTWSP